LKKIEKQEAIEVGTVENLRKRYGLWFLCIFWKSERNLIVNSKN
jgi:hypothetical protein